MVNPMMPWVDSVNQSEGVFLTGHMCDSSDKESQKFAMKVLSLTLL